MINFVFVCAKMSGAKAYIHHSFTNIAPITLEWAKVVTSPYLTSQAYIPALCTVQRLIKTFSTSCFLDLQQQATISMEISD